MTGPGADPPLHPSGERTALLPTGSVPAVAPLAHGIAPAVTAALATGAPAHGEISAGTAADALRAEEIARTRLFIRMGWLLSVVAAATVLVVDAPRVIAGLSVTGLAVGIVVSAGYHRTFTDPARYTERALMTLSV